MKMTLNGMLLLGLCSIRGSAAFFVPAPKVKSLSSLSMYADTLVRERQRVSTLPGVPIQSDQEATQGTRTYDRVGGSTIAPMGPPRYRRERRTTLRPDQQDTTKTWSGLGYRNQGYNNQGYYEGYNNLGTNRGYDDRAYYRGYNSRGYNNWYNNGYNNGYNNRYDNRGYYEGYNNWGYNNNNLGYNRGYYGGRDSTVQGGGRRTWHNRGGGSAATTLQTDGRPLDATVEVWDGPNNTPQRMRMYSEDGYLRPWHIETPPSRTYSNSISVTNSGSMEFPVHADVKSSRNWYGGGGSAIRPNHSYSNYGYGGGSSSASYYPYNGGGLVSPNYVYGGRSTAYSRGETIQGGSLRTFSLSPYTRAARVTLDTEGLPCMARIELLEGPGEARQVGDVHTDDGQPFSAVVETPGNGSTIQIRNTGPMEFPMRATVEPL